MTTLFSLDFDTTPPADETAATTAAHTSGGAGTGAARITSPNPGTNGNKAVWDSDTPHTGTRSLRIDGGNPATFHILNPYEAGTTLAHAYFRCYSRVSALPTAIITFAAIYTATPTLVAGLRMTTTGQLQVRDGTGSTTATSTTTFAANTWFGWEWHLDDAANTQTLKIYDGTYSDLRETISCAYTGTTTRLQVGNVSAWPNSYSAWYDDIVISDSAFPGPLGGPSGNWRMRQSGVWVSANAHIPDGLGAWL